MFNIDLERQQFESILSSSKLIRNQENLWDQTKVEIIKLLEERRQLMNDLVININFIGVVSSGKSTLINALLQQPIMQMGNQITTKSIVQIKHYSDPQIYIIENQDFTVVNQISKIDLNKQREASQVQSIQINSEFHKHLTQEQQNKVIFIDTPGFKMNDLEYNKQILNQLIEINQKDYVIPIYIVVINKTKQEEEQTFMIRLIQQLNSLDQVRESIESIFDEPDQQKELQPQNTFIVLNKYDLVQQMYDYGTLVYRLIANQAYLQSAKHPVVKQQFYYDNKVSLNLQSINDVDQYLNVKHKKLLDFNSLRSKLYLNIELLIRWKLYDKNYAHLKSKLCIFDQLSQNLDLDIGFNFVNELIQFLDKFKIQIYELQQDLYFQKEQVKFSNLQVIQDRLNQKKTYREIQEIITVYQVDAQQRLTNIKQIITMKCNTLITSQMVKLEKYFNSTQNNLESCEIIAICNISVLKHVQNLVNQIYYIFYATDQQQNFDKSFMRIQREIGPLQLKHNLVSQATGLTNLLIRGEEILGSKILDWEVLKPEIVLENIEFFEKRFQQYINQMVNNALITIFKIEDSIRMLLLELCKQ